jgi:hypothetical protein
MLPNATDDQVDSTNAMVKNKREQYSVEIRRKKNEDMMNAKRFKLTNDNKENRAPLIAGTDRVDFVDLGNSAMKYFKDKNFDLLAGVLETIRRSISMTENPPLKALIQSNICPLFAELIGPNYMSYTKVQLESAWILTNISSGEAADTEYAVKLDIIPKFIDLIRHPDDEMSEQVLWGLANISGDSQLFRDQLLNNNILFVLIDHINGQEIKINYVRNMAWLLSNLCRGKPYPPYEKVVDVLPLLARLLKVNDEEVLINVLWTFSYLSDGENEKIQNIIDLGVVPDIINCTNKKTVNVATPALRCVGNMLTGTDIQTDFLLKYHVITYLLNQLNSNRRVFRKEACWAFSNLLAGDYRQIQEVLDTEKVIKRLVEIIYNDDPDVKQEGLYALSNCTNGAVFEQIQFLVSQDIITVFVDAIVATENAKAIITCLDGLHNILKSGNAYIQQGAAMNPYLVKLEDCGGIKAIERLQHHPDTDVYNKISAIIDDYFTVADQPV